MAVQAGQSIGRYHIVEPLGKGGMAIVYRAYDTRLKKDVAVKFIRREAFSELELSNILSRFEQEAVSLARLTHPNIIPIIDYDRFEDTPYLVMPFIPGGTLKDTIAQMVAEGKIFTPAQAARLLGPVANALEFAHRHGILHRDVKPANILITESGEPMLSDFGIARILDTQGNTLTATGTGIGTPEYSAPEQWLGKPEPASDQYALGVVLYEMLTNHRPYTADTPQAVMLMHISDPLPRPRQFTPSLPPDVEKVLFTALAKHPEDRYPSMAEFAQAMQEMADISTRVATSSIQELPNPPREAALPPRPSPMKSATAPATPVVSSAPARPQKLPIWIRVAGIIGMIAVLATGAWLAWTRLGPGAVVPKVQATITQEATEIPVVKASPPTTGPTSPPPSGKVGTGKKICLITDPAGLEDRVYNQMAYQGLQQAIQEFGVEGSFLTPGSEADYPSAMVQQVAQKCDLIITAGSTFTQAVTAAAQKSPKQMFVILDGEAPAGFVNVVGTHYASDQAAFLAGYLAAGMSKSHKVGTFGGYQIDPVTDFMDGFFNGVQHFNLTHPNQQPENKVQVLGWDPGARKGLFTDDFQDIGKAKQFGLDLFSQGADIVLPVDGASGYGAAEAAIDRSGRIIGVDTDWMVTAPQYKNLVLTSILKRIDFSVVEVVRQLLNGKLQGGTLYGTLQSGGVGLGAISSDVPVDLLHELDQVQAEVAAGQIQTTAQNTSDLSETCPPGDTLRCARIAPGQTIKLGLGAPMSGSNGSYGTDIFHGASIAIANGGEINGFKVELIYKDDGGTPEGGASVAKSLASDPTVVAIVGHAFSDPSRTAIPIYEKAGLPMMSPSATNAILTTSGSKVFNRVIFSDKAQGKFAAEYLANRLKKKRLAVLYDTSRYGQDLGGGVAARFKQLGGEVVAQIPITPGKGDYSAQLASLASQKPDALYYGGYVEEAVALTKAMGKAGLQGVIFFGSDGVFNKDYITRTGSSGEGAYAAAVIPPPSDARVRFDNAFQALWNEPAGSHTPFPWNGYDAASVLVAAIKSVAFLGSDNALYIPRGLLIAAVRSTKDYQGLGGIITCDPTGECSATGPIFYMIKNGQWVPAD